MSKKFQLVHSSMDRASVGPSNTNWELCAICQEDTAESLVCPENTKRPNTGSGYKTLAGNLMQFGELGLLPRTLQLDRLDEGEGIEAALVAHKAVYHKRCMLRFNTTKLQRAQKRPAGGSSSGEGNAVPGKRTRSLSAESSTSSQPSCFFCRQSGVDTLHEATTFKIDQRVRQCATQIGDHELLARLSMGDMRALDVKYHSKCLMSLYNRAKSSVNAEDKTGHESVVSGIVLAELALYIEDTHLEEDTSPVFRLADLANLYANRMEHFGVPLDTRVNTTRLKERLLAQLPGLRAQSKGRDVLLAFDEDIGEALGKACELDCDSELVHLARASQIVRRYMFEEANSFTGSFKEGCQQEAVPPVLLSLVNMVLHGPSIKNQFDAPSRQAALSIAQLLKFNGAKHRQKQKRSTSPVGTKTQEHPAVRHATSQETPLPMYIGLMLHTETRKRELVDKLFSCGLSISYDRVLRLSAEMGNRACQMFQTEQVVCPPTLRGSVFTTAAVDNIDHNPSSTTAKDSFHGTGISLLQHPVCADGGVERGIVITGGPAVSRTVDHLPKYYTEVPPVASTVKGSTVPATSVTSLKRASFAEHKEKEYEWLENLRSALEVQDVTTDGVFQKTSWAAYHASNQEPGQAIISPTSLLPLFHESAHTVAMIRHSMDVVRSAIEHLNPGQTPVLAFDQPLFALAKQIQWKWPETHGEDKLVVMFGGLHVEMAALKTLGDWLQGSGWTHALAQAEIAAAGTADSFLRASHVTRTRRAHQLTAAALYILQRRAYDQHSASAEDDQPPEDFEDWCHEKENSSPQFLYWATVLDLELSILIYVRSLREGDFIMYLDALTEIVPWFFALDHINYARWIPVHLRDMAELPQQHPEIYNEFKAGHFTVQKTKRAFSAIPLDQAHEQNNARVKGDGGAVGLTDNPSALRRWMVAGPEVARVIMEFEEANMHPNANEETRHHEETPRAQEAFAKDVQSLVAVIEELGNPFEEDSPDLLVLDTKEIADPAVIETVRTAKQIGQEQFQAYSKDCLIDRTKTIDEPIKRNKLPLFGTDRRPKAPKGKEASVKNDMALFARLYIGCQNRDGNLDEFFRHENQACPPALSDAGKLHLGSKSDLLVCLEGVAEAQSDAPAVTSVVLDGAVIVQMLKPGTAKTFEEYAHQVFIPYVEGQLRRASRLDLVWDSYKDGSLKTATREKRGKGVRRRVVSTAAIPGNWQSFLRVDANKVELFTFLSDVLVQSFHDEAKELVVTDGEAVICLPRQEDESSLAPCGQEEADTRIMLHVAHAAEHDHRRIQVRTVDTDVVVLAVMVAQALPCVDELWIAFGTGKNYRYIPAHEIAASLGPQKARALPVFHAMTGCDTVSAFVGHGKKSAWATWNSFPELTDSLVTLTTTPVNIQDDTMHCIERFVVLLYDRTSPYTDVNEARKKLFAKRNSVQRIPPTYDALEQHVKRSVFQGGYVWGQVLVPQPVLPSPTSWGWRQTEDGSYEPLWTTLPEASKSCFELVSCGCKKGCRNRCKCKKANLQCTGLCACEGECQ